MSTRYLQFQSSKEDGMGLKDGGLIWNPKKEEKKINASKNIFVSIITYYVWNVIAKIVGVGFSGLRQWWSCLTRGKSLLESWGSTFLPVRQPPLIFVWFTSKSLAILLEHMHKKFVINRVKIKGGCQSGSKVVTHNSRSDSPIR